MDSEKLYAAYPSASETRYSRNQVPPTLETVILLFSQIFQTGYVFSNYGVRGFESMGYIVLRVQGTYFLTTQNSLAEKMGESICSDQIHL